MHELHETVNALLKTMLGQNKVITPGKQLVEDLGFDSLKMFELTAALEEEFGVLIPVNRVAHIKTVADLYQAVVNLDRYAMAESEAVESRSGTS